MQKTVNEVFIKFSSKVPFAEAIELGDDLAVSVGTTKGAQSYFFNAVKSEDKDNQDGTVDRIYTLKSLLE